MIFSDMQLWVSNQLGETFSTNTTTDPRFFSLSEFVLWMNLYRKEFNEDSKLLVQNSTVSTVAKQATYAWTAFSPVISQPVDYLRFTYTTTISNDTVITPMNFVDKAQLDTLFVNWDAPQTTSATVGQYIYLNTHNVFGVLGIPGASTDTIGVDWIYPPTDYAATDAGTKTSEFPDDLMDRIPLYAVLAACLRKRGRTQEAQIAQAEYEKQRAKKIGHIRYDQTAKPRNFESFTSKNRRSYRNAY